MGRVTVVTGSAQGMGLSIAQRLAGTGHRVALLDRDGESAERAADEIRAAGGEAIAQAVDVSSRQQVKDAYAKVRSAFGPIEVLVTSAGIDANKKFIDITVEEWDRMLAVNLTGTFHCVQLAVPDMLAAGWGRIVTISSSSAHSGAPRMVHYVASKGGVLGFTKALALELAPKGITVNTIPPGVIYTPMLHRASDAGHLYELEELAKRTPVRRVGTGEDIAAACAFLCSDDAGYITGQSLNVNGGWYL